MTMIIQVQVKDVYGQPMVYPACPRSAIFAKMLGTKTLTHSALCSIEALGFTIEAVSPIIKRAA